MNFQGVLNKINKNKKFLKVIVLSIVLLFSFFFISNNLHEFSKFFDLSFSVFTFLSLLFILNLAVNGYFFKTTLGIFNINLTIKEWFGLTAVNKYSNYLFIKGGPVIRGLYLKKRYNLLYKNFIFIFIAASFIQVFCIAITSIFAIAINYYQTKEFSGLLLIIVSAIPILQLLTLTQKKLFSRFHFIKKYLKFKKSEIYSLIIKLTLLTFFSILLSSTSIYIIYASLFDPILFTSSILITAMGMLSFFVSLTPASIGIKEFFMSYTAELSGLDFTTTIAVASFDRIISIVWIFLLGIIFSIYFSKQIYEQDK